MSYKSIKHNPYKIVKMFEEEVAEYTGAPFGVAVDSCTSALFLCFMYNKYMREKIGRTFGWQSKEVIIPSKTYLSVPMSIIHAGFNVVFDEKMNNWSGIYKLEPHNIYDAAKRLTSDMYMFGTYMCLSFHIKKQISIGKGGMILTDDINAVEWFRKARYEGRSEKSYDKDNIEMLGWNMYMTPQEAAHGLALMQNYPLHVPDLGEHGGYKDLRTNDIFKNCKVI